MTRAALKDRSAANCVFGISAMLLSEVGEFTERYSWILSPVLLFGVFAAIASIAVAVYVASYDESIPP